MANFPDIMLPKYPFKEKLEDPSISSKQENGLVISRPRFTRMRSTFTLSWTALPEVDFATLRTFYRSVYGGSNSFTWVYPTIAGDEYSGRSFTVLFNGELDFDLAAPGLYSGSVTLQEV